MVPEPAADPTQAPRPSRGRLRGRWRALPLRVRLVVLITTLLVAGLGIAGTATVTLLGRYLVSQVDAELAEGGVGIAQSAFDRLPRTEGAPRPPSHFYIEYTPDDGGFRHVSPPESYYASGSPVLTGLTSADALERGHEPFTVRSTAAGEYWRVVLYTTATGQDINGYLAVGLPLTGVTETAHQIGRVLLATGLAIVLLGGVAAYWAVRRALQPLRDVEATAQAFAAGDLAQRVPAEPETTEVGRLARSLNGMLAQIERAFAARAASEARMRRFVADASHELRTPLSTVRGYGELYRMGAIGPDEVGPAMRRIEDEAVRMGALVNDLLQLAKLDEGRPLDLRPVDLRRLAADAVVDLRALDPARSVTLVGLTADPPGEDPLLVRGDEARLRQVVSNLIGNAAQHTPPGTPTQIAVGRAPDGAGGDTVAGDVVLEVRDHGPGIPPQDAERVFERFYRVDTSRARTSGGSGLGLAIVAAVTAAHGGTVRVLPTEGGGTTVRLSLPALGPKGSREPAAASADDALTSEAAPTGHL
jgi:two-component system OmpR family sensor kinase